MDVSINGEYAGGSFGKFGPGGTGGKTVSGVPIQLGTQEIKWALSGGEHQPRLGEIIVRKAELKALPRDHRFLAIYIYPDETVEVATSVHYPEDSKKGEEYRRAR